MRSLSQAGGGPSLRLAAATFVLGMMTATLAGQWVGGTTHRPAETSSTTGSATSYEAAPATGYPAEVLRVIDGDTFEARVRIWPGLDTTTRIRLRGIDAPELHARCNEERVKAEAARDALSGLLAAGNVGISHVSRDKYGGRVVADASASGAASVAESLLAAGHVRRYGGGRRQGWCAARSS